MRSFWHVHFRLDTHRSDHDRVERARDRERRSPSDNDRSRSPLPSKSSANDTSASTREGTERMSMSVEETNKMRAALGLKPLTVDDKPTGDPDAPKKSANSDENFVHKPAANITEKKRSEQLMEKLSVQKEKRQLQEKFLYVSHGSDACGLNDAVLVVAGARRRWRRNQRTRQHRGLIKCAKWMKRSARQQHAYVRFDIVRHSRRIPGVCCRPSYSNKWTRRSRVTLHHEELRPDNRRR